MPNFTVTNLDTEQVLDLHTENELLAVKRAAIMEHWATRNGFAMKEALEHVSHLDSVEAVNDFFFAEYTVEKIYL